VDRLRIVVGFKVTPDYEALRASDWARAADGAPESGGGSGGPETRYVRRLFNVFDEAALELALRLRDAHAEAGLETSLAAFSVAGREADPFLRTLQALGFDGAARVEPGAGLDFAPRVTAAVIAAYLRRIGTPDVLLLGSRCGPGESGTVPFLVADELGLPWLTEVTEVLAASPGRLRVTFTVGGGQARATVALPCVLAVGNAVISMLRVPTLKDRLATRDRHLDVLSPGERGVDVDAALAEEPALLLGFETIDRERAGTIVAGRTPAEKARALYETQLRARLEEL
jgi:electron transfer flavoprotein alpha/beta subunit